MAEPTALQFPALLKTRQGVVLVEGQATVESAPGQITFTGEFVPLFPMGTPLEIMRIMDGHEVHRFRGTVYISNESMLRLIGVEDRLMIDPANPCLNNLPFHGLLEPMPGELPQPKKWFIKKAVQEELLHHHVAITAISDKEITISYDSSQPFYAGDQFYLTAQPPLALPKTPIMILRALVFGVQASFLCTYLYLPIAPRQLLRHSLVEYSVKHAATLPYRSSGSRDLICCKSSWVEAAASR